MYYGGRHYSPSLGRFINRDRIAEAGGLNLYGFCGNDGIDRFDVLGNGCLSDKWKQVRHAVTKIWHTVERPVITSALMAINPAQGYAYLAIDGYQSGGWKGARHIELELCE